MFSDVEQYADFFVRCYRKNAGSFEGGIAGGDIAGIAALCAVSYERYCELRREGCGAEALGSSVLFFRDVEGSGTGRVGGSTPGVVDTSEVEPECGGNFGGDDCQRGSEAVGSGPWRAPSVFGKLPRGPNYERNQLNRLRKKAAKEVRRTQASSYTFAQCDEETQVELRNTRAKMLIAENKRRLIEEERKIARLQSPVAILDDAMRMVEVAERAAKLEGDHGVAGWAKTVATSYSESIARSAPVSVRSYDSVKSSKSSLLTKSVVSASSAGGFERRRAGCGETSLRSSINLSVLARTKVEEAAVNAGFLTEKQVLAARQRVGRALNFSDLVADDSRFNFKNYQKRMLMDAEIGGEY